MRSISGQSHDLSRGRSPFFINPQVWLGTSGLCAPQEGYNPRYAYILEEKGLITLPDGFKRRTPPASAFEAGVTPLYNTRNSWNSEWAD